MADEVKGIAASLIACMSEIDAVTKEGTNQKQGYKYVRAADVANEVRKILVKHGVCFGFDVVEEERWQTDRFDGQGTRIGHMNYVRIVANCEFEDAATGQIKVRKGRGWGQDVGEKAIYKAMTGALKYVLRMNFIIPDESDPENEGRERISPAEAERRVVHKAAMEKWNKLDPSAESAPVSKLKQELKASLASTGPQAVPKPAHRFEFIEPNMLICTIHSFTPPAEGKKFAIVKFNGFRKTCNFASCWDKKLWPALKDSVGKEVQLAVDEKDKEGIHYINIEDLLKVEGTEYAYGVPIQERTV
jgi:hypothetical protein